MQTFRSRQPFKYQESPQHQTLGRAGSCALALQALPATMKLDDNPPVGFGDPMMPAALG
jgi:hypothetical protein